MKALINETKDEYLRKWEKYRENIFEIFPLCNVLQLLIGIRNNFIDRSVKFSLDDKIKIVKWDHIKKCYEIDIASF